PEIRAEIDRRRLSDLGVSADTVANALRTAVGGSVVTQLRPEGDQQIDVRVLMSDADRANVSTLGALPVSTEGGQVIRLDQVAMLKQDSGPAQIQRSDRQRVISISGSAA